MAPVEHPARAIDCPAGTILQWAPGTTPPPALTQYELGGSRIRYRSLAPRSPDRGSRRRGASSS
jgi:hypothetical protein